MCSALPGQERKLPQGCSFNAEYFYAKTALVMRVSGLVEALEIMSKNFVFQTQIRISVGKEKQTFDRNRNTKIGSPANPYGGTCEIPWPTRVSTGRNSTQDAGYAPHTTPEDQNSFYVILLAVFFDQTRSQCRLIKVHCRFGALNG